MTPDDRTTHIHPGILTLTLDSAIAKTVRETYVQGDMDYTHWLERSLIYAIQAHKLAEQALADFVARGGSTTIIVPRDAVHLDTD